jgi:hypothetical protein
MIARRRAGLAAVLALVAWGCNSHFDFDEHPTSDDAAEPLADAPAPPRPDAPLADGRPVLDASGSAGPVVCSVDTPACLCSGTLCSCARQQWCQFTGSICVPGAPCSFLCHNGSRCEGQCQHDCRLECENQSTCKLTLGDNSSAEGESSVLTLTVGPQSRVHCENNATCHVTCTGACSLECQQGARCDLRCAGDAAAHTADQGGTCLR